ncbi:ImmA/IrrE family metallo-endopeptidase [Paenibacillus athensensis]|uniref:ImmA/IrrE family metallo-endopeptidase n=1 Tax=Paenibacillus athensensis TaxID=1967502 RepID=UPI00106FA0B4|nr:ImmA/IrrE family metallo-endopeptidase [Paenibacillus athensensis]MCD1259479.1 ImmA/IrrE family metallo-endopeptidase [Paenibacillus athensensis]
MLFSYQPTPLEQWINQLFEQLDVTSPEHLNIGYLSGKLNIWVYYMDMGSMAVEQNGLFSINIDRRLSRQEQWEDFLHEICHVLRHAGNQMHMPTPYLEWQEQDAGNFQLYAALPFSMIRQLILPERQSEAVELLTEEFNVTPRLAVTRLEQIQRRRLQGILDQEFYDTAVRKPRKYDSSNWSEQTRLVMDKLDRLRQRKGGR